MVPQIMISIIIAISCFTTFAINVPDNSIGCMINSWNGEDYCEAGNDEDKKICKDILNENGLTNETALHNYCHIIKMEEPENPPQNYEFVEWYKYYLDSKANTCGVKDPLEWCLEAINALSYYTTASLLISAPDNTVGCMINSWNGEEYCEAGNDEDKQICKDILNENGLTNETALQNYCHIIKMEKPENPPQNYEFVDWYKYYLDTKANTCGIQDSLEWCSGAIKALSYYTTATLPISAPDDSVDCMVNSWNANDYCETKDEEDKQICKDILNENGLSNDSAVEDYCHIIKIEKPENPPQNYEFVEWYKYYLDTKANTCGVQDPLKWCSGAIKALSYYSSLPNGAPVSASMVKSAA